MVEWLALAPAVAAGVALAFFGFVEFIKLTLNYI